MEQKITKIEEIFEEAQKSSLDIKVGIAVACLHNCVLSLENDCKAGMLEALKKFPLKDVVTIICNRLLGEFGASVMLNAISHEEKEQFQKRVEEAFEELKHPLEGKGGKA